MILIMISGTAIGFIIGFTLTIKNPKNDLFSSSSSNFRDSDGDYLL